MGAYPLLGLLKPVVNHTSNQNAAWRKKDLAKGLLSAYKGGEIRVVLRLGPAGCERFVEGWLARRTGRMTNEFSWEVFSVNRPEIKATSEVRPGYVAPTVTTLTEDQVFDEVGPAQAYTGNVPFGF